MLFLVFFLNPVTVFFDEGLHNPCAETGTAYAHSEEIGQYRQGERQRENRIESGCGTSQAEQQEDDYLHPISAFLFFSQTNLFSHISKNLSLFIYKYSENIRM